MLTSPDQGPVSAADAAESEVFPELNDQFFPSDPEFAPLTNEDTFRLHSRPQSNYTIFLDFDGSITEGTGWNNSTGIETLIDIPYDRNSNPDAFSNSELNEIRDIWRLVAEDFAPFDVNVTTEDPGTEALKKSGGPDTQWGVRSLHTSNLNKVCGSCGGVAYLGSFTSAIDLPTYTFNKGVSSGGNTHSHEVGHSLRLGHDGKGGGTYYSGHGDGNTSWGPIMGSPSNKKLKTWSNGDYSQASNQQDDLDRISTLNGFAYRSDDHGNAIATSSPLEITDGAALSGFGIIETSNDLDFFSFSTDEGSVSFDIEPYLAHPNLDIWAGIYDSAGSLIAESNPGDEVSASFENLPLSAGDYFLRVEGVGTHGVYSPNLDHVLDPGEAGYGGQEQDPPWSVEPPTGYSDYASVGQYWISGSRVIASENTLALESVVPSSKEGDTGTTVLTFRVARSGDLDSEVQVGYSVLADVPASDNGLSPFTVDANDFADAELPDGDVIIPIGQESAEFTIEVAADTEFERDETFRLMISEPTSGWRITDSTVIGLIESDETSVGFQSLSTSIAAQEEGDPGAGADYVLTLFRSGDTTVATTANWEVQLDGFDVAASEDDFAGGIRPSGEVVFDPGVTSVDIGFSVSGDVVTELDESFRVVLTAVSGSNVVRVDPGSSSRRGIILEDEAPVSVLSEVQFRWRQIGNGGGTRDVWAIDDVSLSTTGFADDFDPVIEQAMWALIENGEANTNGSVFPGDNGAELLMTGTGNRIAMTIPLQPGAGAQLEFDLIIGNGTGSGGNGGDNAESGKDVWLEYSVDGVHWDLLKKMDTDDYESWKTVTVDLPERAIVPQVFASEGNADVTEIEFSLVRSGNVEKAAPVTWQVVPSGEFPIDENDLDSSGFPGGVHTFESGEDVARVVVPILADALNEADETFQVVITEYNAGPVTSGTREGRVSNDDAPGVSRVVLSNGEVQRSAIREIDVVFEGLVDIPADAVSLTFLGSAVSPVSEPVNDLVVTIIDDQGATKVGLSRAGGASLVDGNYRLDVVGANVMSRYGNWAMDDDFSFGDVVADKFYRKYGDVTGNGTVDLLDFSELRQSFGSTEGELGFRDELDFDDDDSIGLVDFAAFRANFGT